MGTEMVAHRSNVVKGDVEVFQHPIHVLTEFVLAGREKAAHQRVVNLRVGGEQSIGACLITLGEGVDERRDEVDRDAYR